MLNSFPRQQEFNTSTQKFSTKFNLSTRLKGECELILQIKFILNLVGLKWLPAAWYNL